MPAYLSRFQYDLFISHAWSGNPDPDAGDRGWAKEFQRKLETDVGETLARRVSVFFDDRDAMNGNVDHEFRHTVEQSALFIAIVTPSFCLPTCFCLKELEWFHEGARPISSQPLDVARRIFRVMSRPVAPEALPGQLSGSLTYNCFEGAPQPPYLQFSRLPVATLDQNADTQLFRSYRSVVNQLAGLLDDCRQAQANHPIRRIFVAETTCVQRLQLAAELKPHELVSVSYTPGTSLQDFADKTALVLDGCDRSVHLVDTAAPLTPLPGSGQSALEIQLQCALAIDKPSFKASVWCDASVPVADPALNDWIDGLWTRFPDSTSLEYISKGFQYLLSNLTRESGDPGPKPEPSPVQPGMLLYVQCMESDKARLMDVVRALRDMNCQVSFQMKPSKKSEVSFVKTVNEERLAKAKAALYYWGSDHVPGMYIECDQAAASQAAAGKKLLIGLDPNEDVREVEAHPRYKPIAFPAHRPSVAVASLIVELAGGGN